MHVSIYVFGKLVKHDTSLKACACMQISQTRLEEVQRELGALADKLQPLQLRYESEKVRLADLRSLQQKKEDLQVRLQQAENRLDLAMVADIRYIHHHIAKLHNVMLIHNNGNTTVVN